MKTIRSGTSSAQWEISATLLVAGPFEDVAADEARFFAAGAFEFSARLGERKSIAAKLANSAGRRRRHPPCPRAPRASLRGC